MYHLDKYFKKFPFLLTENMCVFCRVSRTNGDYLPVHQLPTGLYNSKEVCFRGTNWFC